MKTGNPTIDLFIIETVLINPVNDIVRKLEQKEFRDCDIKWLDSKLESFTAFACKTLGQTVVMPSQMNRSGYTMLNEYVYNLYLKYFKTLLDYFKSF